MSSLSLHAASPAAALHYPQLAPTMDAVKLRHLRSPREIQSVLALRNGIDLSAHVGSPEFVQLEKKEMK